LFSIKNNTISGMHCHSVHTFFTIARLSPVLFNQAQNTFLINLNNTVMKQFYSGFLSWALRKALLLFVVFWGASNVSNGQVYYTTLSGPNEFPTNSSPGTGKAVVTIDGNLMRVQVTFSGLVPQTSTGLPSGTTASHIHAPTPVPLSLTSTAGVATQTPTFADFPLGVRAGTYDHSFDMTQNSSYNPAYITANGGTAASAFTALKTAIAAGKSYLNIHSNAFGGGEIRGFLLACPTINVSIADASALPSGVVANTVYPAYAPASSLTLQSNVSGGTGPYSYNWSNGAITSSVTVSPTAATTYSVAVKDQNGCPGLATKTVNVMDISGGNKGDKIVVCHNQSAVTIATPAVASHLQHNDMLGSCESSNAVTARSRHLEETDFTVKVLANPSRNFFDIQLRGQAADKIQMTVYDNQGRVIETKSSVASNQTVRLGSFYNPGVYLVVIVQGTQKQTLRLVKTN
jgi:hypothetical protein